MSASPVCCARAARSRRFVRRVSPVAPAEAFVGSKYRATPSDSDALSQSVGSVDRASAAAVRVDASTACIGLSFATYPSAPSDAAKAMLTTAATAGGTP